MKLLNNRTAYIEFKKSLFQIVVKKVVALILAFPRNSFIRGDDRFKVAQYLAVLLTIKLRFLLTFENANIPHNHIPNDEVHIAYLADTFLLDMLDHLITKSLN
jgi:hypothetical protein